eukprot:341425_1
MEDKPLLKDENMNNNTICQKLFKCTWYRFVKLIEISLMALQIVVVILDWSSSPCNHALHIWMIVSLSYRLSSLIFQWICIEPCLIYLRRDRSSQISKDEDSNCCYNLLFCWVIPWLWIIDNDIFLLIWTIFGTLLIFDAHVAFSSLHTCNWQYIEHNIYPKLFIFTMITILIISYIYWLTTLIISLSLFCCPQIINNCCLKMGYGISKAKGDPRINSITSIDASQISDMPGIRNTLSYSITAPSRHKGSLRTPTHTAQYTPPHNKGLTNVTTNKPLSTHIFKQFKRKLFHKKQPLTISNSPKTVPDADTILLQSTNNNLGIHFNTNNNNNKQKESYDIKETFETESKHQQLNTPNSSFISQTTITSDDMSYPIPVPATFKSNIQNGNGANSFSYIRHLLSAKKSKFSNEFVSNLEPLPAEHKMNKNTENDTKVSPYLTNCHLYVDNRDPSPSISLILNVFDNVAGLNNLPSPNVLRRISKSPGISRNDNMMPLDLNDSNVFTPPLTQKALDMKIVRPLLFQKKYSILKDINLIVDVGDNCCALCQNMYKNKELLCILSCNHQFHDICVAKWFSYKSICPLCRKKM